jgi:hypothetical protein
MDLTKIFIPCVMVDNKLFEIAPPRNLRTVSFIWDPITLREIGRMMNNGDIVDGIHTQLEFGFEIPTFHEYTIQNYFYPSVAEVLSQVPEHILKKIGSTHYFCTQAVKTEDDTGVTFNKQYHVARSWFFK